MQKLFTAKVRFSNSSDPWKEKALETVAKKITDKNTNNLFNKVLSNSATQGIVLQNDYFDKSIANKDNLDSYYILENGSFAYNPRISKNAPAGPINRNTLLETGVVSPLYTVFKIHDNEVIQFFEYYFKSSHWIKYMYRVANYGARHDRMNISNKDFFKMPLPYPSKIEQKETVKVLSDADKEINLLKKELEELKQQKKGLMQKLLTGQVRVSV